MRWFSRSSTSHPLRSTASQELGKGQDWGVLNRLHEKGMIGDPKNKNKSVVLTEEGALRSEELFERFFGK